MQVLAAAMEGSHTLMEVNILRKRVFACMLATRCVFGMIEGKWAHCADNPGVGDTGVEAVVRMAATTPALKTLVLSSACVCAWVLFA